MSIRIANALSAIRGTLKENNPNVDFDLSTVGASITVRPAEEVTSDDIDAITSIDEIDGRRIEHRPDMGEDDVEWFELQS